MKRTLPIILVLALVAASVLYFIRQRSDGSLDLAKGRAAELAPADSILFFEIPDVARTGQRWKETSLYKISEEPEWREFVAKWGDFATQNSGAKEVFGVIGEIQLADPAGLFMAMTSFDDPAPKVVGGFPYRGKKSDVQSVIGRLRAQMLKSAPAVKSELVQHEGTEIETLTDKNFTAALAYRDNWFFFATDLDLLKGTLSRYTGKAPAGLSKDPLYVETLKQGTPEPDLLVFVRWKTIFEKLQKDLVSTSVARPVMVDPYGTESLLYTAKLDGLLMRDRFYARMAKPPKSDPLANRSLGFTSPASYAYMALNTNLVESFITTMMKSLEPMGAQMEIDKAFAPKGLKFTDLFTTFGSEVAMLSDWEAGGLSLPTFFAAVEVRDPAKARLFAELITDSMKTEGELVKKDESGTTLWSLTTTVPTMQPTLGLNDKHMFFGLNYATAAAGLKQLKSGTTNLSQSSAFQGALKTVPAPSGTLLYVDLKTLFERLYEKFKPSLAFVLLQDPEVAKYFDGAKLPKAETISRHLLPIALTYSSAEQGMIAEGAGSLSIFQAYVPMVGGMFWTMRSSKSFPPPFSAPPSVTVPNAPGNTFIEDAPPAK